MKIVDTIESLDSKKYADEILNNLLPFASQYFNINSETLSIRIVTEDNITAYYDTDLIEIVINDSVIDKYTFDFTYKMYVFFHEFTHYVQHIRKSYDFDDPNFERDYEDQYPFHPMEMEAHTEGEKLRDLYLDLEFKRV